MKSSALHELHDVSILFDSVELAESVWRQVAQTDATSTVFGASLGSLHPAPMPRDILDTRLVEPSFTMGAAYISLKLGVMDQFEIRRMLRTSTALGIPSKPGVFGRLKKLFRRDDRHD